VIHGVAPKPHELLGVGEKFAELADYVNNGKLPDGAFIRWETIQTPNREAWTENELFCENYGFRPNGPNSKDTMGHGIYQKDLNGDYLEPLTEQLISKIGIVLEIKEEESEEL
jgi:hypothetical protein